MHGHTWIQSQAANGFVSASANCWILRPTIPSKKSVRGISFASDYPARNNPASTCAKVRREKIAFSLIPLNAAVESIRLSNHFASRPMDDSSCTR